MRKPWRADICSDSALLHPGRALSARGRVLAAGEAAVCPGQGLLGLSPVSAQQQGLQTWSLPAAPSDYKELFIVIPRNKKKKERELFENNNSMHLILLLVLETT